MQFREYGERVKKLNFTVPEKREFWLAALILGFAYSWNKWGGVEFDLWVGIGNLLAAFIVAISTLFIHHWGQRLWAAYKGYKVEHKVWWYGVGAAFLITLLSNGNVVLLAVTGTFISIIPHQRMGSFRYGPNVKDFAMIALMGPLANIVAAGFLKTLQPWLPFTNLIEMFFIFSLTFAGWNLLPLPPLDGSRILFSSRLLYILVAAAVIGYVMLIQLTGVYSWIWALAIGAVTWLIFYASIERKLGSH